MKRILLFISLFFILLIVNAQNNPIIGYQKINEISGGFTGVLHQDDYFGATVDSIGDLNGDGITDIIVGNSGDDDGGTTTGAVYILFLNSDGTVNHQQRIGYNDGGFSGVLNGGDFFGAGVSSIGDMNNDGINDVAVGAEYDGDAGYWRGAIYILFLDTNGMVQGYNKINETDLGTTFTGTPTFGSDIANLGDLNGDGIVDLAVGARRADGGSNREGAVYILFMDSLGGVQSFQKIGESQGGFMHSLDTDDKFGNSVTNIGDLDGDGNIDIAVGAYRDDDGGTDLGALYILFLNSDGTVNHEQKLSSLEGNLNMSLYPDQLFGITVAAVGDINWDNKMDILVGAPGDALNGTASGAFYILYLDTNGTVIDHQYVTEGESDFNGDLDVDDFFGRGVASIGKYGNFYRLLIGASHDSDNGGVHKGAVWILSIKGEINTETDVLTENDIYLYPNPASNNISLGYRHLLNNSEVQVFDISGKQLNLDIDYQTNKAVINVSNLKTGLYFVKFGNLTKKFIKN